jgi:precorrin-6B methylase 2
MLRCPLFASAIFLVTVASGCGPGTPPPGRARVKLLLPRYEEHHHVQPPRVATVKINGQEYTLPPQASGWSHILDVTPPEETATVEVELSFWPVAYSNTFRARSAVLRAGVATQVDFRKEDPERPDRFEAIFVQTPAEPVAEMLRMIKVTKDDAIIDIGSGNGFVVIEAVKAGARKGVGVDIRPELVELSKQEAARAGVAGRCEFQVGDALKLTEKELSAYSVVFLCLGEDLQTRLRPVLQKLPVGTRIAAVTHLIEGWPPDETRMVDVPSRGRKYTVYLWTVK